MQTNKRPFEVQSNQPLHLMSTLLLLLLWTKNNNKTRWIVCRHIERTKKTFVMCSRCAPWKLNEWQNNVSDRFVARYCFARAHRIATAHIMTWVLNRIVVIDLYNASDCWCTHFAFEFVCAVDTVIFNNGLCHCYSFYRNCDWKCLLRDIYRYRLWLHCTEYTQLSPDWRFNAIYDNIWAVKRTRRCDLQPLKIHISSCMGWHQ